MNIAFNKTNLKKYAIPITIGVVVLVYVFRNTLNPVKKPMSADNAVREENGVPADGNVIDRAINRLKNGQVKVNKSEQEA